MQIVEFESVEWEAISNFASCAIDKELNWGFDSLDEVERIVFCAWVADGEVSNGGMHAVCYNSTGDYLPHVPSAFRAIGANRKAALFEELSLVFGREGPSIDRQHRIKQHESLSEACIAKIDALDDQYFATSEEVADLVFLYLKGIGKLSLQVM